MSQLRFDNKKNINGILLLDKPLGLTSNAALQKVKKLFGAKKAGHTGSLDPLATGMLPICFGEATKFSQFLLESDKEYRVTGKLGIKTTTGDAEGDVIATKPFENVTHADLEKILPKFTGAIQQIPPMYSAVKHQGKPLYKLARNGIEVPRLPRTVMVYHLALAEFSKDLFTLDVRCSKGTYVRTLIEDIGELLGCGAHVVELRRSRVSPYQIASTITLDKLEILLQEKGSSALNDFLLPIESSVMNLPAIHLSNSAAFYLRQGQPIIAPHLPANGFVRIYSDLGEFMGVGEIMDDGRVSPSRLIKFSR